MQIPARDDEDAEGAGDAVAANHAEEVKLISPDRAPRQKRS